jgi:hypothetical protein
MKKVFTILLMFSCLISQATNYYVAKTGSDNNSGILANPWLTIHRGVYLSELVAGDTLFVRDGIYNEGANSTEGVYVAFAGGDGTAEHPITITNYPGEHPIIDGGLTDSTVVGNPQTGIVVAIKYLNISGFEIRNGNGVGLTVMGSGKGEHCTISHMNIHDTWNSSGIKIVSDYAIIEDCEVYNINMTNSIYHGWYPDGRPYFNGAGITITNCNHGTVRRCVVHDIWGEAVSTFESTYSTIEDNIISDGWSIYLYLQNTNHSLAQRNFLYRTKNMTNGSQVGILLGNEGGYSIESNYNTIINNIVYGCSRNLMVGYDPLDNILIANNTFVNSIYYACVQIYDNIEVINSKFENNIIVQDDALPVSGPFPVNLTLGHNLWSKTADLSAQGTGDIFGDPLFVGGSPYLALSYRLQNNSPAINAGADVGLTTDFYNHSIKGLPDLGAIESSGYILRQGDKLVRQNSKIMHTSINTQPE